MSFFHGVVSAITGGGSAGGTKPAPRASVTAPPPVSSSSTAHAAAAVPPPLHGAVRPPHPMSDVVSPVVDGPITGGFFNLSVAATHAAPTSSVHPTKSGVPGMAGGAGAPAAGTATMFGLPVAGGHAATTSSASLFEGMQLSMGGSSATPASVHDSAAAAAAAASGAPSSFGFLSSAASAPPAASEAHPAAPAPLPLSSFSFLATSPPVSAPAPVPASVEAVAPEGRRQSAVTSFSFLAPAAAASPPVDAQPTSSLASHETGVSGTAGGSLLDFLGSAATNEPLTSPAEPGVQSLSSFLGSATATAPVHDARDDASPAPSPAPAVQHAMAVPHDAMHQPVMSLEPQVGPSGTIRKKKGGFRPGFGRDEAPPAALPPTTGIPAPSHAPASALPPTNLASPGVEVPAMLSGLTMHAGSVSKTPDAYSSPGVPASSMLAGLHVHTTHEEAEGSAQPPASTASVIVHEEAALDPRVHASMSSIMSRYAVSNAAAPSSASSIGGSPAVTSSPPVPTGSAAALERRRASTAMTADSIPASPEQQASLPSVFAGLHVAAPAVGMPSATPPTSAMPSMFGNLMVQSSASGSPAQAGEPAVRPASVSDASATPASLPTPEPGSLAALLAVAAAQPVTASAPPTSLPLSAFQAVESQEVKFAHAQRDFVSSSGAVHSRLADLKHRMRLVLESEKVAVNTLEAQRTQLAQLEAQQNAAISAEQFDVAESLNTAIEEVRAAAGAAELERRHLGVERQRLEDEQAEVFDSSLSLALATAASLATFEAYCSGVRDRFAHDSRQRQASAQERLKSDEEQLRMKEEHVELDAKVVREETQQVERAIEEQSAELSASVTELETRRTVLADEIASLMRLLEAKQAEEREVLARLEDSEHRLQQIRHKFERQHKRLELRQTALQAELSECATDRAAVAAAKKELEAMSITNAHMEAGYARQAEYVRLQTALVKQLDEMLQRQHARRLAWKKTAEEAGAKALALQQAYDAAVARLREVQGKRAVLEAEAATQRAEMEGVDAKVPALNEEKKAAVAERKFKEASRLTAELKRLSEMREGAERHLSAALTSIDACDADILECAGAVSATQAACVAHGKEADLGRVHVLEETVRDVRRQLRRFMKPFVLPPLQGDVDDAALSILLDDDGFTPLQRGAQALLIAERDVLADELNQLCLKHGAAVDLEGDAETTDSDAEASSEPAAATSVTTEVAAAAIAIDSEDEAESAAAGAGASVAVAPETTVTEVYVADAGIEALYGAMSAASAGVALGEEDDLSADVDANAGAGAAGTDNPAPAVDVKVVARAFLSVMAALEEKQTQLSAAVEAEDYDAADVLQEDIDAMEDHKALLITKAAAAGVDDLPAFSASLSSVQTTDDADEGSNTPVVAEEGSEVVREEGGAASPAADVADSEVIPAESIADSGAVEQHTSGASAEDKASTPTDVSADASQVEDESAAA